MDWVFNSQIPQAWPTNDMLLHNQYFALVRKRFSEQLKIQWTTQDSVKNNDSFTNEPALELSRKWRT